MHTQSSLISFLVLSTAAIAQPSITPLATFADGDPISIWVAIDDQSEHIVGSALYDGFRRGYRWQRSANWSPTYFPNEGSWFIGSIDSDGTAVPMLNGDFDPFIWTSENGIIPLETENRTVVGGISNDGRVVVGEVNFVAHRWVDGVAERIGPADNNSTAHVANADGSVIFGHDYSSENWGMFRWMNGQYDLITGSYPRDDTYYFDCNDDGSVAVGYGLSMDEEHSDSGDGLIDQIYPYILEGDVERQLPIDASRFYQYIVSAMSQDAQTIVGEANHVGTIDDLEALFWDHQTHVVTLREELTRLGVDITGWEFDRITDITADGRYMVGAGKLNGQTTAFVVDRGVGYACAPDMNNDGNIELGDVSEFLVQFAQESYIADFNNDGRFNFFDISDFIAQYQLGCL